MLALLFAIAHATTASVIEVTATATSETSIELTSTICTECEKESSLSTSLETLVSTVGPETVEPSTAVYSSYLLNTTVVPASTAVETEAHQSSVVSISANNAAALGLQNSISLFAGLWALM